MRGLQSDCSSISILNIFNEEMKEVAGGFVGVNWLVDILRLREERVQCRLLLRRIRQKTD